MFITVIAAGLVACSAAVVMEQPPGKTSDVVLEEAINEVADRLDLVEHRITDDRFDKIMSAIGALSTEIAINKKAQTFNSVGTTTGGLTLATIIAAMGAKMHNDSKKNGTGAPPTPTGT